MDQLKGTRTAVFASSMSYDYAQMQAKDPDDIPRDSITGSAPSILANRISWYFDLSGPSVLVDTACSGSMVALDLACQSIRSGNASAVRYLPLKTLKRFLSTYSLTVRLLLWV